MFRVAADPNRVYKGLKRVRERETHVGSEQQRGGSGVKPHLVDTTIKQLLRPPPRLIPLAVPATKTEHTVLAAS